MITERKWMRCHKHGRVLGGRTQMNALVELILICATFGLWLPIAIWFAAKPYRCPICNSPPGWRLPLWGNLIIILAIVLAAFAGAFK